MFLLDVFAAAADGQLPTPDGQVEVHPGQLGKAAAVVAFPAHFYVLAPVEPHWVRTQLSGLCVPMSCRSGLDTSSVHHRPEPAR